MDSFVYFLLLSQNKKSFWFIEKIIKFNNKKKTVPRKIQIKLIRAKSFQHIKHWIYSQHAMHYGPVELLGILFKKIGGWVIFKKFLCHRQLSLIELNLRMRKKLKLIDRWLRCCVYNSINYLIVWWMISFLF